MHMLHNSYTLLTNLTNTHFFFYLDTLDGMENHTLEDTNKVRGMEKEMKSLETLGERLHTGLMDIEKEQQSTMMKMERKKTDFIRMIS